MGIWLINISNVEYIVVGISNVGYVVIYLSNVGYIVVWYIQRLVYSVIISNVEYII